MMETSYFTLAGWTYRLDTPAPVEFTAELRDFLIPPPVHTDEWISFEPADRLPEPAAGGFRFDQRCFVKTPDGELVCHDCGPGTEPYAAVCYGPDRRVRVRYRPDSGEVPMRSHVLVNLLGLEQLLLRRGTLILHASFIRHRGRGILFSAPSGTGKSTQADLWAAHMGAQILNGDRAAIRLAEDGWRAYGLPYAGSSRIYRNESAPLEAIVLLRQNKENRIRPAAPAEALRSLLPEFSVHRWDQEFVDKVLDLAAVLLQAVPVYVLECTPDRRAVELLDRTIEIGGAR